MDDAMRIEMALKEKRFEENGAEVQALLIVVEHQVEEHAHTTVTSHAYEGDGGPCEAEAYGQPCGAPRRTHELDEGRGAVEAEEK